MTPERWRHITATFHLALARTGVRRNAFLGEACAGDPDLRQEVARCWPPMTRAGRFGDIPMAVHRSNQAREGPYVSSTGSAAVGWARSTERTIPVRRAVAIKVLSSDVASDVSLRHGFRRGARRRRTEPSEHLHAARCRR